MMLLIISILFIVLFVFCFYKKINLSEQFGTTTVLTPIKNYMGIEGNDITDIYKDTITDDAKLYLFLYDFSAKETKSVQVSSSINYNSDITSTLELRYAKVINSELSFKFNIDVGTILYPSDNNYGEDRIALLYNSLDTWKVYFTENDNSSNTTETNSPKNYYLYMETNGAGETFKDVSNSDIANFVSGTNYRFSFKITDTMITITIFNENDSSSTTTLSKPFINKENYNNDKKYTYYFGSEYIDLNTKYNNEHTVYQFKGSFSDIKYNEKYASTDKVELRTNVSRCKFPYQLKGNESIETLKTLDSMGIITYDKKGIHYSHLEYNDNKQKCKDTCTELDEVDGTCTTDICDKKCERVGVCSFNAGINNSRHEIDCIKKCLAVNECTIDYCKNQCYNCNTDCFWNKYNDEKENLKEDSLGRPRNIRIDIKYTSPDGTKASIKWQINSNIKTKLNNDAGGFYMLLYKTYNENDGVIVNKLSIINCADYCEYVYSDLIPNTVYTVGVKSYNKYGVGEMSNLITFKTIRRKINPITNIEDVEFKDPNPNIEVCK